MIFDWRSRSYRGGSGWLQAGLVVVAVGIAPPEAAAIVPANVDITGTFTPDVTLTGTFTPDVTVTGTFEPNLDITGSIDMATEAALTGLFVGADQTVTYSDSSDAPPDMTAWTLVLDIRKTDKSGTSLLSSTGVVSGTYNADPDINAQVCTFTLTDDDLAASIFTGNEFEGRYSIKRTNAGFELPVAYGNITITRVTQT